MNRIAFLTTSRADFGLLKNLILAVQKDKSMRSFVVVSGGHLELTQGNTIKEIQSSGIKIFSKIKISATHDNSINKVKMASKLMDQLANNLIKCKPDILVLLGDRFEVLTAAQVAMILQIPVCHIHGGEKTLGTIDELARHAITKLSHIHLTVSKEYQKRVLQMGESKMTTYLVGSPAIEAMKNIKVASRQKFEQETGFKFSRKNILVTFHPARYSEVNYKQAINELLMAIDQFKNINVLFTASNLDEGGDYYNKKILEYVNKNKNRAAFVKSLGQTNYFSALQLFDVVVGNSSSGVIEAPYFLTPTVNVGPRQDGRIRARSVIDVVENRIKIQKAIQSALKMKLKSKPNIFGKGDFSIQALKILKSIKKINTRKEFYDFA